MFKRLFFLISIILVLVLVGNASAALVGRWTFDDRTADDSSGNNHHGTLSYGDATTNITFTYDADRDSNVLDCTNPAGHTTNSVVDCGVGSWADITPSITIAVWTKPKTIWHGLANYLVTKGSAYQATAVSSGLARFYSQQYPVGYREFYSTNSLLDGKWHHVAYTYNNTTESRRVYFDGELETEEFVTASAYVHGDALTIGGRLRTNYNHRGWDGLIDDVRIYNKALSAEEVEELYHGQLLSLEITGPGEVAENSQAQYKAIAHYDNNSTADVTASADWSVEPNDNCSIAAGLLTTEPIDLPEEVTIYAEYNEDGNTVEAEKAVEVFAVCPSGSALDFDGGDDYVDCGNDESLDVTELTWSLWIRRTETTYANERALISNTGPKTGPGEARGTYALQIDVGGQHQDKIQFVIHGIVSVSSNTAINNMNWHHIAVTRYINGDVTIYIDGYEDATGYIPERTAYGKTLIGTGHESYSNFKGTIDEVAIFNRALNAEEIQELMHTKPDGEPNLVGYWDFDEGSGQEAADSSGNGNDGTLGSGPGVDNSDPCWVDSVPPVGECTLDGLVGRNISNVLDIKADILELLDIALGKEGALLDYMDDAFHNGEFDNLNKNDVVQAKQKLHSAIQHEEQAETTIGQSLEKLNDALDALGIDPTSWHQSEIEEEIIRADINADGVVDFRDFTILTEHWLESSGK